MKVEFHRKTFVILGQLGAMGKDDAWKKIQELGGYVSSTPRPSSDYIVVANRPGQKLSTAKRLKKPILTEAEFLAAIKAVETGREEGQENVEFSDALAGLRELLLEAPSAKVWGQVQELLDQCDPAQLEVAVDYTEQHIATWPGGDEHEGAPLPLPFEAPPAEQRTFSIAWRNLVLAGERSPQLRLGRSLDLSRMKLKGEEAMRITDHPDLVQLRSLNIGASNLLDASFYKRLICSEHLPQLTSLTLSQLVAEIVAVLCGEHKMTHLRYVTLGPLADYGYGGGGTSTAVYKQLFAAEWWEQIEGLACCTSGLYGAYQRSIYPQLAANVHRMVKLRHLILEDTNGVGELLKTDLFASLRRLSIALSNAESSLLVLEHLAERRGEHGVEALDLSRGIFVGEYSRPKKYAKSTQQAAVDRLLQDADWGALREVTVEASLLGVRRKKKLDAWGEEAGITIIASPWTA